MGNQDKGLVPYKGRPLIEHVLDIIRPQVQEIVISANRNLDQYQQYTSKLVKDTESENRGPLAGVHSGLQKIDAPYTLLVACDQPMLPVDLVEKLYAPFITNPELQVSCAKVLGSIQPLNAIIKTELSKELDIFIGRDEYSVKRWYQTLNTYQVDFSTQAEHFANVNETSQLI